MTSDRLLRLAPSEKAPLMTTETTAQHEEENFKMEQNF
jgi:hypothetical protein